MKEPDMHNTLTHTPLAEPTRPRLLLDTDESSHLAMENLPPETCVWSHTFSDFDGTCTGVICTEPGVTVVTYTDPVWHTVDQWLACKWHSIEIAEHAWNSPGTLQPILVSFPHGLAEGFLQDGGA